MRLDSDGAKWIVAVSKNEVVTKVTSKHTPLEWVLYLVPRGTEWFAEREYDAAFDLPPGLTAKSWRGDPLTLRIVDRMVEDRYPYRSEAPLIAPFERGLRLSLVVEPGDFDELYGYSHSDYYAPVVKANELAAAIGLELGWIVYAPLVESTLRPGSRFREQARDRLKEIQRQSPHYAMWKAL